jgi:hypothetical protein
MPVDGGVLLLDADTRCFMDLRIVQKATAEAYATKTCAQCGRPA